MMCNKQPISTANKGKITPNELTDQHVLGLICEHE